MKNFLYILFVMVCSLQITAQSAMNMGLVGSYTYSNNECSDIWGYVDSTGNEYALVGLRNGFSVVDLSSPSNPNQNFFIAGAQSIWRDIKVWNNYAFITCDQGTDGLLIVDLNDMSGNTYVYTTIDQNGQNMFTHAHNIYIDEFGKAYIFGGDVGTVGGALILDVNSVNLTNGNVVLPSIIGLFDTYYLHDGMARGDTLWGAAIYQGNFYAIDVSTPSTPVIMNNGVAFHPTPDNFTHNCWISDDGNTLYTTDEVSGAYLGAYDVSDLNNIYEVDRIQSSPGSGVIPHNTHVLGDFIVTSYYRDGITVHDVTYPNNMIEVAYYDQYAGSGNGFDGSWGAYPWLPSGLILSSDINSGPNGEGMLLVLEPSFQQACYLEGNIYNTSGQNISGATVEILTTNTSANSNLNGYYFTGTANSGQYLVVFSAPGYFSDTLNVGLQNGVLTVLNDTLVSMTPISVSGQVLDDLGQGIANAQVSIVNNGFGVNTLTYTDANGIYTLDTAYTGLYDVQVGSWGYNTFCDIIEIDNNGNMINITLSKGYYDDFTFDFGWTTSSNATSGEWVRDKPNGTSNNGVYFQTDEDVLVDCSNKCFVTGNTSNSQFWDDIVNDGNVTLFSPIFDLTTYNNPVINYYRWFANSGWPGSTPDDSLIISIFNGNNSEVLEIVTANSNTLNQWHYNTASINIPLTSNMQLQVYTADLNDPHIVEAAFDLFQIEELSVFHDWECIAGSCIELGGNAGSFLSEADCLQSCVQSSISDINNNIVFPNPTKSNIQLVSSYIGIVYVKDSMGKVLQILEKKEDILNISLNDYSPGIYIIDTVEEKLKIVKQ